MSEIYEGNSITVNNINKSKAKIKIRGGSWQETRSGKNKLNFKNIDSTLAQSVTYSIKEGIITLDGTASGLLNIYSETFEVTETGQYTLSKNTGGIFDIGTGTSTPSILIQQKQTDGSFSTVQGTELSAKSTSNSITFKLEKGTYRLRIFTAAGNSLNNFSWKPQLENGIEATSYEKHGVSPSPDFPSEIKNVTGEINKYYIPNTGKVKSYGITATYTKNTSEIILDGVATRDFSDGFEIKNILLKKGTYSVSVWGLNKINEEYDRFFVADTSNNNKVIVNYVQSYRTQKFTLEQDTNIKLSFIIKAGSTYSNAKIKIMINEGDIGLSYIPYNSLKIRKIGKNILSDNRDDYNGSTYGYIKLLNNFENNNLVLSIEDNDKSIDMTGINFGVTGNGKNWDDKGIWLLYNGKKVGNSISTNKYLFFSFYPNNQTTFNKIFKRYKIQAEISKGIVPTEFEKYKSNSWIFPLEPGQKLYEGSYLAEDGIHNTRKQIVLTGNENWKRDNTIDTTKTILFKADNNIVNNTNVNEVTFKSNYFIHKRWIDSIYKKLDEPYISQTEITNLYININKDVLASLDVEGLKAWLSEHNVIVEYPLAEEEIIPYTPEQQNAFYQLQNIVLYDGINHISTDNELGSMSVEVSKIIEDYETYISSNGFFINSQNDIHYLIDFSESELPCMAEATETTVKAAGRNGDIVLSTTYDPNNFNIVCYTEDNLTQEEKVKEEMKLKKLLNSIKNKTIPLAFEKDDKFYKVKYSGAFSSTNFPKHLKFSIPLKTSESYGKDLIKKVIFGNGEETSDTFEDVGAIFTIKGPANSPIISLNDYSIEYDNPLLEGDKLIINSSNSTITHINSDGVKTNAMRYYNHQFPKIENGKNVLKVLSGVNEANVSVEWYDYKF